MPTITRRQVSLLVSFNNMTVEEVSQNYDLCQISSVSLTQCRHDSSKICDMLAPITTSMRTYLSQRVFPKSHKHAVIHPRIKNPFFDIKSYRPLSNLSLVSKTVKCPAVRLLNVNANQYGLFSERQSAYRQYHSTETAITIIHNDVVRSTDASLVSALVQLDLSMAFSTVDHSILLGFTQQAIHSKLRNLD